MKARTRRLAGICRCGGGLQPRVGVWTMAFVASVVTVTCALADGVIITNPEAPLAIKNHIVTVNIDNQVATTHVDQTFLNETEIGPIEGTYIFPLPEGATVSDFAMDVDGEIQHGVLMPADSARMIYEEIVRRQLDPALLEYAGRGAYKARIFPIEACSEKRVQLDYTEILTMEDGVCRFVYPLNTEKFSSKPLEYVRVEVMLSSNVPIKNVHSALHNVVVDRVDDYHVNVVYADEETVPNQDFVLYYTVSTEDVGLNLLTYGDGSEYGYYLLMMAPKVQLEEWEIAGKRVVFALDTSGSMRGTKLEQAKAALIFCLNALNPADEFNIVDFATQVKQISEICLKPEAEHITSATDYVNAFEAEGMTNTNGALLAALELMRDDGMINTIVFLTDGKPTEGITDPDVICQNVQAANDAGTRIFVFGVGNEVNTHLLDELSGQNHGFSSYVREDESVDDVVGSFFLKASNPVLADVRVDFGDGITVQDAYPDELADLFQGSQLLQLGRFGGEGETTITLEGQVGGEPKRYEYPATFHRQDERHDFIPRLWATRKIGYLLDLIRLNRDNEALVEEAKGEIVHLATRYGIVTEYTSFLIQEETRDQPLILDDGYFADSGEEALTAAENVWGWKSGGTTEEVRAMEIKYVGDKTFYEQGSFWQDSEYVEGDETQDYVFGSEEYFALIASKPYLGKYLGLGTNVIVAADGVNYRTMEAGTDIEEDAEEPELPGTFGLDQNAPNPFNPSTTVRFTVPDAGRRVTLAVYDLQGQRIRRLVDGAMSGGVHSVAWDGKDEIGREVGSGVYVCRMVVDGGRWMETRKMVLIR